MAVDVLVNKKCEYDNECPNNGTDAVKFGSFGINMEVYFLCPRHADHLIETHSTPCTGMAKRLTGLILTRNN